MRVSHLKELEPLVQVRELKPGSKYLVSVPGYFRIERIQQLARALEKSGVSALIISGQDVHFLAIDFPEQADQTPAAVPDNCKV
jgi:hypothetical protein